MEKINTMMFPSLDEALQEYENLVAWKEGESIKDFNPDEFDKKIKDFLRLVWASGAAFNLYCPKHENIARTYCKQCIIDECIKAIRELPESNEYYIENKISYELALSKTIKNLEALKK